MLSEAWLSHGKVDLALTSIGLFRASTTTREPFTRSLLTNKTGSGLINEILRCQLPPLCVLFCLHTKQAKGWIAVLCEMVPGSKKNRLKAWICWFYVMFFDAEFIECNGTGAEDLPAEIASSSCVSVHIPNLSTVLPLIIELVDWLGFATCFQQVSLLMDLLDNVNSLINYNIR